MPGTQLDSQVTTGLYGKLPIFGDFIVRHLDAEFVNSWDSWLQDGLTNSRQVLGSAWLDNYLVAPIWRFVIGPGMLGDGAWIGVMIPSVDRVGRYFPLTLAQPINPDLDITATYLANREWFQSIEDLGVDALRQDLNFEEYVSRLRKFPAPDSVVDIDASEIATYAPGSVFLSSSFWPLSEGNYGDHASQVGDEISGSRQPASLWGMECADTHEHFVLAAGALPNKEGFCALLDKSFEAHGWISAPPLNCAKSYGSGCGQALTATACRLRKFPSQ